jgi:predicted small secreted protein
MMPRLALLTVFAVSIASVLSCASNTFSGAGEPDFDEVVRRYRELDSHKALALATEADGRWVYGVRFASASQEQAIEEAIESCRNRARLDGTRAQCIPFAVENEPAPETVRDCLKGTIPSRRCAMQRRHYGALTNP